MNLWLGQGKRPGACGYRGECIQSISQRKLCYDAWIPQKKKKYLMLN